MRHVQTIGLSDIEPSNFSLSTKLAALVAICLLLSLFRTGGAQVHATKSDQNYLEVKYWPQEESPLTEEDKERIKDLYRERVISNPDYPQAETYKIAIRFFHSESLGWDRADEKIKELIRDFRAKRRGVALAVDLNTRTAKFIGAKDKVTNNFVRRSLTDFFNSDGSLVTRTVKLGEKIADKIIVDQSDTSSLSCDKQIPDKEREFLGCGSGEHENDRKIRVTEYYLDKSTCQIKEKTHIDYVYDPSCRLGEEDEGENEKGGKEDGDREIELIKVKHRFRDKISLPDMKQKLEDMTNSNQELPAHSQYKYLHYSLLVESPLPYKQTVSLLDFDLDGSRIYGNPKFTIHTKTMGLDKYQFDIYVPYLKQEGNRISEVFGIGRYKFLLRVKEEDDGFRTLDVDEFEILGRKLPGSCGELQDSDRSKIDLVFYGLDYSSRSKFKEDIRTSLYGERGLFSLKPFAANKDLFRVQYFNRISHSADCMGDIDLEHYDYQRCQEPAELRFQCPIEHENTVTIYFINKKFVSDATFQGDSKAGQTSRIAVGRGPMYKLRFPETFIHELGHALGHLRDEYVEKEEGDRPGRPNCADNQLKAKQWWGDLVGEGTGKTEVGYYEGCSYVEDNIRPHQCSIMSRPSTCYEHGFGPVNLRYLCQEAELTQGICSNYN